MSAVLLIAAMVLGAHAADDPTALAAEAIRANPGIASMEARVSELDALARVADTWPDPVAGIEYSNVPVSTFGLGDHPMAGLQFKVQQTIPTPGLTALRQDVAESWVAVAQASLDEARLALARAVEETWWRLALVRQLREVTAAHVALTDQLVGAVRARYETGGAAQSALVRLEVLRDKLQDDLGDYERQDRQLTAALGAALHRAPGTPLDTPDETSPVSPAADTTGWIARALESRPALEEQRAAEQRARLTARLARADARPDLTVWGGYRVRTVQTATDPGTDLASVGLSVPLAFNSARRGRGQAAASLHAAEGARQRQDTVIDGITADLETAHAAWLRADDKARVYEDDLLPAAHRALDTTLADYRVDKADFASLYQAEVQLLDLDRARLIAITETHIQDATVRATIGQPVAAQDEQ